MQSRATKSGRHIHTRIEHTEVLREGVETSDGVFPATLLEQSEGEVRLTVMEGKYRMVRRILANVGLPVVGLHRVRYGAVELDQLGLQVGEHTAELPAEALEWAKSLQPRGRAAG